MTQLTIWQLCGGDELTRQAESRIRQCAYATVVSRHNGGGFYAASPAP
ncbi:hypothetical protein [Kosakonia sacchari]|uniref:Uncharacterized protein n=1 Tax=Kosakonia sacchari TaxID=1158459 RepID=A0ABZ0MRN6_9ENTR|nr:hypothetical protein [Kosakonia sacchari]WOZ77541.1 hypothetical protein Q8Y70_00255 [Kosakonia sacchari]